MFPGLGAHFREVARSVDPDLLVMARSYRVGPLHRLTGIYLPFLIPAMLAATRIGFTNAWKIVLLSEVFGFPGGLGFELREAYNIFNLPRLLAWLVIFVVSLLLIEQVLRLAERRIVKWA